MKSLKGFFVTVEGGDGSGKTTLIQRILSDWKKQGRDYLHTREPGGTLLGEEIRTILLKTGRKIDAITELFLYEAARADHVQNFILPALNEGKHVLCDRFTHSSLAYQGAGREIGMDVVENLNAIATKGLKPNCTIWLKIEPSAALSRVRGRGNEDRLESESLQFHEKIFQAYEKMQKQDNGRTWIVLDATLSPDAVYAQLMQNELWKTLH